MVRGGELAGREGAGSGREQFWTLWCYDESISLLASLIALSRRRIIRLPSISRLLGNPDETRYGRLP